MADDKDDKKKKKKMSAIDFFRKTVSDKSAAGILRDRKKEMDRRIKESGG